LAVPAGAGVEDAGGAGGGLDGGVGGVDGAAGEAEGAGAAGFAAGAQDMATTARARTRTAMTTNALFLNTSWDPSLKKFMDKNWDAFNEVSSPYASSNNRSGLFPTVCVKIH